MRYVYESVPAVHDCLVYISTHGTLVCMMICVSSTFVYRAVFPDLGGLSPKDAIDFVQSYNDKMLEIKNISSDYVLLGHILLFCY